MSTHNASGSTNPQQPLYKTNAGFQPSPSKPGTGNIGLWRPVTAGGPQAVLTLAQAATSRAPIQAGDGILVLPDQSMATSRWNAQEWGPILRSRAERQEILRPQDPTAMASTQEGTFHIYAQCALHVSVPSGSSPIVPQPALLQITNNNAELLNRLYRASAGGTVKQYGKAVLYKSRNCQRVYFIGCLNDYDQPALLPISSFIVTKFESWLNAGLNVAQQIQLLFSKASRSGFNVSISLLGGNISQYCRVFLISGRVFVRRSLRSERRATMPAGYKQYFRLPKFDWKKLAFLTTPHPTNSDIGQIKPRKIEAFVEAYFKCLRDRTVHGGTLLPDQPQSPIAFLFERYAIYVDAHQGFRCLGFQIQGLDRYEASAGEKSALLQSIGNPKTLGIKKSTWYPDHTIFYVDLPVHDIPATGFFSVLANGDYKYVFRVQCSFKELGIDGYDFYNRWLSWKNQGSRLDVVLKYPFSTLAGNSEYVFKLEELSKYDIAGPTTARVK